MVYREWNRLACPRCAEALDDLGGGVWLCVACEGLWIAKPALGKLTALRWPAGHGVWWRNELACPECLAAGEAPPKATMQARQAGAILVDLCPAHGGWFDRGELARLFGLVESEDATSADDLAALHARIVMHVPERGTIDERRARHAADLEARRDAVAAYAAAASDDRADRAARAARERREHEHRADELRAHELAERTVRLRDLAAAHEVARAAVEVARERLAEAHAQFERTARALADAQASRYD